MGVNRFYVTITLALSSAVVYTRHLFRPREECLTHQCNILREHKNQTNTEIKQRWGQQEITEMLKQKNTNSWTPVFENRIHCFINGKQPGSNKGVSLISNGQKTIKCIRSPSIYFTERCLSYQQWPENYQVYPIAINLLYCTTSVANFYIVQIILIDGNVDYEYLTMPSRHMTSIQRRLNVMTLHRRWDDVV